MTQATQPPRTGRPFYSITENEDGTADVFLNPHADTDLTTEEAREHGLTIRVVRGVEPWDGMEEDIRRRYDAWCESGEEINL